jgi:hypothetical protein
MLFKDEWYYVAPYAEYRLDFNDVGYPDFLRDAAKRLNLYVSPDDPQVFMALGKDADAFLDLLEEEFGGTEDIYVSEATEMYDSPEQELLAWGYR